MAQKWELRVTKKHNNSARIEFTFNTLEEVKEFIETADECKIASLVYELEVYETNE